MPYTVESYKKKKGDDEPRWHVEGERDDYAAAEKLYAAVCVRRVGAVILRGEGGELVAKRSGEAS